ncbi:MAG: hypothetical protein AB1638_00785 [Nitrospirota bacterium]
MANGMIVTYGCEKCGSEIVITKTGETLLSPIYCCGVRVTEISTVAKKPAKAKEKPIRKVVKKVVKKPVAKKRASKKK